MGLTKKILLSDPDFSTQRHKKYSQRCSIRLIIMPSTLMSSPNKHHVPVASA